MQKALPFIHFPQFPFLSQPKKAGTKSLSRIVRGQQKHLDFFPKWGYSEVRLRKGTSSMKFCIELCSGQMKR